MVVLIRWASRLSLSLAHRLGAAAGWLFSVVPNPHRRITQINIALCFPHLSPGEQHRLVRRSLVETGKTVTETPSIWGADREYILNLVAEVSGQDWVDDAIAAGRGVVLIAPHLGSWELVNIYCSALWGMTTLYRPLRFSSLEDAVRQGRERLGAAMVPTNTAGVRALLEALKRNEMVAITPDQDPRSGGLFAPFFGIPAHTMTLLPRLIAKSNATPLLSFAERLPKGRGFHLHFLPAPEGIGGSDPQQAAITLNKAVEQCVRQIPEQYQWSYKRFRNRPPGERRFYPKRRRFL